MTDVSQSILVLLTCMQGRLEPVSILDGIPGFGGRAPAAWQAHSQALLAGIQHLLAQAHLHRPSHALPNSTGCMTTAAHASRCLHQDQHKFQNVWHGAALTLHDEMQRSRCWQCAAARTCRKLTTGSASSCRRCHRVCTVDPAPSLSLPDSAVAWCSRGHAAASRL